MSEVLEAPVRPALADFVEGEGASASRRTYAERSPWRASEVVGEFGPHEQGRAALDYYAEVATVYQDV